MSTTHWYARYIGDYNRKTSHLSMVQHGAYTLLLDWYYANELPIPLDSMQVHRICRAFADDEKNATDYVLALFFEKTEKGWINTRAQQEIEKKRLVSEKRANAAGKRWSNSNANAYANGYANDDAKHMLSTTTSTTTSKTTAKDKVLANSSPNFSQDDFENLWIAWVPFEMSKGSKQEALKSYMKSRKEADHETIIRTAAEYLNQCRSSQTKSKHVSTWLNQRGWAETYEHCIASRKHFPHDVFGQALAQAAREHPEHGGAGLVRQAVGFPETQASDDFSGITLDARDYQ